WRWRFVLAGLPVAGLGFVVLAVMTERPEGAAWLTADERAIVRERVASEKRPKEVRHLGPALKDPRVLILAGVQFGFLVGSYGVGIWLPQILRTGHLTDLEIGFFSSGAYAFASVGMILLAGHIDRGGNKDT